MFDVILKGGEINDGSGADGYTGDVAIKGGIIAEVGEVDATYASQIIDVSGLVVSLLALSTCTPIQNSP